MCSSDLELGSRGDVALTLCRSVGQLSRNDNRNRLGHAGWVTATPAAQEPGRHVVEFSIAPARRSVGPTASVHPIWIRAAHREHDLSPPGESRDQRHHAHRAPRPPAGLDREGHHHRAGSRQATEVGQVLD